MESKHIRKILNSEFKNDERIWAMQSFYGLESVVEIVNFFLEKQKGNNEELEENLKRIIDRIEESDLQDYFPSAYTRAKAIIQKVNEKE